MIKKILHATGAVLVVLLGSSMILQVFQRFVMNQSLSWPDELAGLLLALITFVGAASCSADGEHIGFEGLQEALAGRWGLALRTLADVLSVLFFGVIAYYAIPIVIRMWGHTPTTIPVPTGMFFAFVPICFALMAFFVIVRSPVYRRISGYREASSDTARSHSQAKM